MEGHGKSHFFICTWCLLWTYFNATAVRGLQRCWSADFLVASQLLEPKSVHKKTLHLWQHIVVSVLYTKEHYSFYDCLHLIFWDLLKLPLSIASSFYAAVKTGEVFLHIPWLLCESQRRFLQFNLFHCLVKLPRQLLPSKFLNIWTGVKDLFFRCYFWKLQIVMCQSEFNVESLKAHILRKYLALCSRLWRMRNLYQENFWFYFFFCSRSKIKSSKHLHRKRNKWKYLSLGPNSTNNLISLFITQGA